MARSREEHLAWCKSRALAIVDEGDPAGGVASMISDLGKWEGGPMYEATTLNFLALDGMMFQGKTDAGARHWIEGFN